MNKNKKIQYCNPVFQEIIRRTVGPIINNYFNIRTKGKENISEKNSLIFSCNHVNAIDPFILASLTKRINYAMSKKELFPPVIRKIMVGMGAFPVETKPIKTDYNELTKNYGLLIPKRKHKGFLEEINQYISKEDKLNNLSTLDYKLFTEYVLNTEGGLVIFLPGTRSKDYSEINNPKKGVAWSAFGMYEKYKTIVNIIPSSLVYSQNKKPITNEHKIKYQTDIDIILGKPITVENYFEEYKSNKEKTVTNLTNIIAKEVNSQVNVIFEKRNFLKSN